MAAAQVEVLGIRHHGPGSARALRRALEDYAPDIILIEGPPEADSIIDLAADPGMVPPVALLAYVPSGAPSGSAQAPRKTRKQGASVGPGDGVAPENPGGGVVSENTGEGAATENVGGGSADEEARGDVTAEAAGGRSETSEGGEGLAPREGGAGRRADVGALVPVVVEAERVGSGRDEGADPFGGSSLGGAVQAADRDIAPKKGRGAAFWPFADFSPEWQAIRYGLAAGVPIRFCDLPAAHQLAGPGNGRHPADVPDQAEEPDRSGAPDTEEERDRSGAPDTEEETDGPVAVRLDPLGRLAEAAGYDDPERWWDDVVEHRGEGPSPFAAIAEAMAELRAQTPEIPGRYGQREAQREAYMRRTLRRALKEGYERVAVVCGAWHVPAISTKFPVGKDDQILRGLPKTKVEITWVPWTHGRLATESGYGAGVRSPGWYRHLFNAPDRPIERWLTAAARLLREEDLPVSSAHVIEAVRLAETLAALRDRPLAGLDEVTEATRAVLCEGADLPLELINRRMVVGERLGSVPETTPMVPLQRDLQAEQRRLKLRPAALDSQHELDLRKPFDLDRSRLLHRLRLLNVPWGVPGGDNRSKGTFRESWTLAWRPEYDVELIEASAWGTSVHAAATAKAIAMARALRTGRSEELAQGASANAGTSTARGSGGLAELTSLAERCLLADLAEALPEVMRALGDRAAADTDVAHLMSALPPLVRSLRYGDVRGTPTGPLRTVVDGLVTRIGIGLPVAVSGLDDDAARQLLKRIDEVHAALGLLGDDEHIAGWQATLRTVVDRAGLHGLLEGRLTRLLRDAGDLPDVEIRMARAVSVGQTPQRAAAWVEGFLAGGSGGSGLVLLHDAELLRLVDEWISGLPADSFTDVLPLLRRTFSAFESPERRAIGSRVRNLSSSEHGPAPEDESRLDETRAAPAAARVSEIFGWPPQDLPWQLQ